MGLIDREKGNILQAETLDPFEQNKIVKMIRYVPYSRFRLNVSIPRSHLGLLRALYTILIVETSDVRLLFLTRAQRVTRQG